jgi:hypothetical protein
MPSIAPALTSRPSASSSPCIHAAQRSTSSASSPMTSETPEPGFCLPAVLPVSYAEHPATLYPARSSAVDRSHPKRFTIQKYTTLASLALSKTSMRPPNLSHQKSVRASKMTPLRNGCCVVTTGTAKTSLGALRAQTDHPLDQPALAEGVFTFDLFGLCCGLCLQSAACRTHLFLSKIRMR